MSPTTESGLKFTPQIEAIIQEALDQRDNALLSLERLQREYDNLDAATYELRSNASAQVEFFDHQRDSMDDLRTRERNKLMDSFANATKQMLQKIDALEKEARDARVESSKQPSMLNSYSNSSLASQQSIPSMNIFVAKEKERDAFVAAATKLHKFIETIVAFDPNQTVDASKLIMDAKLILKVKGPS